jgi:hypothetical protein
MMIGVCEAQECVKWDRNFKVQGVQPSLEPKDTLSGTGTLKYRVFSLVLNLRIR